MEVNKVEPYHTIPQKATNHWQHRLRYYFPYVYNSITVKQYLVQATKYTSNIPAISLSTCIQNWFICHLHFQTSAREVYRTVCSSWGWSQSFPTSAKSVYSCLFKGLRTCSDSSSLLKEYVNYHSFGPTCRPTSPSTLVALSTQRDCCAFSGTSAACPSNLCCYDCPVESDLWYSSMCKRRSC